MSNGQTGNSMSSEAEDDKAKADYRDRNPYKAIPGQIAWAANMLHDQGACCDEFPQDTVKIIADTLVLLIENRTFARPKELAWTAGGCAKILQRLCDKDILRKAVSREGGEYYKFTIYTKAWSYWTAERLAPR